MNQNDIFTAGEADAYTARNAKHNAKYRIDDDIVAQCIDDHVPNPRRILDLGCSSGERLSALSDRHGAFGVGVDASKKAIDAAMARDRRSFWFVGDWTDPDFEGYDLVITSYVWHWVDRALLTRALLAVDKAVATGGYLIINDFYSIADVPYAHAEGVMTYKRHYPEMFLATGLYEQVLFRPYLYSKESSDPCVCAVLRKK